MKMFKTMYKYGYSLGTEAERTSEGKYIIYHRGERKEIEVSSVEFWSDLSNPEPMTRAEFDEVTKGTKGIIKVVGVFKDEEKDAKYYTPTIEEFHVGFECEWQSKIRNESWNKQIVDVDLLNIVYGELEHADEDEPFKEQFRVKYLDKEDIESLGFVGQKHFFSDSDYQKLIDDYLFYEINYTDEHILTVEEFYQSKWVAIPINEYNSCTVFKGTIKNKSELKVLLKQLGIYNGK